MKAISFLKGRQTCVNALKITNMKKELKVVIQIVGFCILIGVGCRKPNEDMLSPSQQTVPQNINGESINQRSINERFDSYVAQSWYGLLLKLVIETPGHTPPIAARSLGYTGIALYESLVGEMKDNHSLVGKLNGLTMMPQHQFGNSYVAPISANAALARIIKDLFANASTANQGKIDALELANYNLYSEHVSDLILNRSRDYGRAVADAVFKWSLTDGGNQAYLNNFPASYVPPVGIDKWIPTPPLFLGAMLPSWGGHRLMIASNGPGPVDPPAPPAFSTSPGSPFYAAASEVYNTGLHLTSEQNAIALYWNDGGGSFTPPGHNIAIALQIIRNRNLNLNQAAMVLAKVGIAENDAGIVCWRAKFGHNLLRPSTFIDSYIAPSWKPLIGTPPFPTYTSGHATFSGASAGILTAEFGNHFSFTDSSKINYGFAPRFFVNFNEAAQEAAMSRLYGGIHYRFDNENGFICGQLVASNVERINW